MIKRSTSSLLIFGITLFTLQNCGSSKVSTSQGGFYHSGIYFGKHFPANYQQGIADGCTTAKGIYKNLIDYLTVMAIIIMVGFWDVIVVEYY